MKIFRYILLVALVSQVGVWGYAQQKQPAKKQAAPTPAPAPAPVESPGDKALKEEFNKFVAAYANIMTSKDVQTVTRFMTPTVSAVLFNASITDQIKQTSGNINDFENYMNKIIKTPGLTMTYNVINTPVIQTRENTGSVMYVVEYETRINGGIWSEGVENVMLVYRKISGEWKIIHYTILGIENEKEKGACQCEMFKAESENFVTKTTIPSGRGYTTNMEHFTFTYTSTQERLVLVGDNAFKWKRDGELWLLKEKKVGEYSEEKLLFKTHTIDKEQLILTLIKDFFYKENCTNVQVVKK